VREIASLGGDISAFVHPLVGGVQAQARPLKFGGSERLAAAA
jgi:hypothetical protein